MLGMRMPGRCVPPDDLVYAGCPARRGSPARKQRKFGDSVRAKNDQAMKSEVLAKFVCHNLCCLIHAMEEFGIDPTFGRKAV